MQTVWTRMANEYLEGKSLRYAASQTGLSLATLRRASIGENTPSGETLEAIAYAKEMTLGDFFRYLGKLADEQDSKDCGIKIWRDAGSPNTV